MMYSSQNLGTKQSSTNKNRGAFPKLPRSKLRNLPREFFEFCGKLKNLLRESQKSFPEHFRKNSGVFWKIFGENSFFLYNDR